MVEYNPSPTLEKFHADDNFVRALLGPIGSGKSVGCAVDLWSRGMRQKPNKDGFRKSRWVIIRNTYRELIDTTMLTFFDWFPRELGIYRAQDLKFTVAMPVGDNTSVHMEFLFRALDKPDDIKKLLSLELTGGWINEAREIPKEVLDMLLGRVGRYPSMRDGGASWFGVILDTNPPDSDHWFYSLFEESKPDNYSLYHQPSGVSAEAENLDNLPLGYYDNIMAGKDQEWINVYVHGKYGFIADGKPVYPEYKDDIHFTQDRYIPTADTIYIGIDFGLTPAAVFVQRTPSGRIVVFDELVTEDMGAKNFSKLLKNKMSGEYGEFSDFEIYADPAGDIRAQTDEITPFQILWANGVPAMPTYTNDFIVRREAVAAALMRLDFSGNPGFALGPKASVFRKGMAGGYKYRRMAIAGRTAMFQDKPDKGRYSHVCEAAQYALLGMGEGTKLVSGDSWNTKIDYSGIDRTIV